MRKAEEIKAHCYSPGKTVKPNYPVHVTAARLRISGNMKGPIWAAARDGRTLARIP
ncbi:MAG: hypothetical protein AB7P18_09520 [Candidatus Binatia bacterium]